MKKGFRSDDFVFTPTAMAAALGPLVGKPLTFSRVPKASRGSVVLPVSA